MRPGLYMMVDMGAGTTEFSISHVNELDADHRVLCYADTSILLGGNQFNENDRINAGKDELRLEEERLRKKLLGKLDSVWYMGFRKDKDGGPALKNRWKQLNVLLSGGGLRRTSLQTAIEQKPPMKSIFGNDETDYQVSWHHPADLELPGNSADDLPRSLAYFAVAHGLSLERQKWPKRHPPGEVENSDGDVKIDNPLEYGYLEW